MSNPLDGLRAAVELVEQARPTLHYLTSVEVPEGQAYQIAAHHIYPVVWLFHPADFERQRTELARHARLVDHRTWRPTPEQERAAWADLIADLKRTIGRRDGE